MTCDLPPPEGCRLVKEGSEYQRQGGPDSKTPVWQPLHSGGPVINQPESSVVARQMSGVSEMNCAEEKKGRGNEEGRVEEMRRGGKVAVS